MLRHFSKLTLSLLLCCFATTLQAVYTTVYTTNNNGGIAFTGNTLGLNKTNNQNNPGIAGSIGAFTALSASKVNNYPIGTTLNWTQNASSAYLDLPAGSQVLFAELVWSGSYGFDPAITNNNDLSVTGASAITNTPITFSTPIGNNTVTPTIAKSRVNSGSNGFYVRAADVTSLVQAGGAGLYTVGGVPATVIAGENNSNCAGWTLCVAYQNPNMLSGNLSIIVGCEASGAPPAQITGFHAPDSGSISGRLFVSALEGDPQLTGDQFLIGNTPVLTSPANQISGTNNPPNNFFASQINTILNFTTDLTNGKLVAVGSSVLDTRGTFGTLNSFATGTAVSGARQGYDITSIDIGSKIQNSQTVLYAQGTTTSDVYTITALGLQIQFKAPSILSTKEANYGDNVAVGDTVTFTLTFKNVGELQADNLVVTDQVPAGMSFVNDSLLVNNVFNPGDPNVGVAIGNLAVNDTVVVSFEALVDSPIQKSYVNSATVNYSFTPDGSTTPVLLSSETNQVILSPPAIPAPVANDDTGKTDANTPLNGASVLTNDVGVDLFVKTYDQVTTQSGSVVMQSDGTYLYTPPTNFSGIDTFTYTVQDSVGQTATATVRITVYPVAIGDINSVASGVTLHVTNPSNGLLDNDLGSGLSVITYDVTSTAGGSVSVNPDGTYSYTSFMGFSGIDTFSYTIKDSLGNTSTAIVTITVLPLAQNNFGTTPANTPLEGTTVFTNDLGTGLTLVSWQNPSSQGGVVVMDPATGIYMYTPPLNFSGIDTFTYTEKDAFGNTSSATVTITVLPVARDNFANTLVNVPISKPSVLNNDAGTGLYVSSYDQVTLQGGHVSMHPNGTYTYTPPQNFSGTDTFTYTATDQAGNTTSATVTITVEPRAVNDHVITNADTPLSAPSVLANDLGTTLQVIGFQNPSNQGGQVFMNADGTFEYIPPPGFSGDDQFNYQIVDGNGQETTGTVFIKVLPLARDDFASTNVNTPVSGNVLTNDVGTGLHVIAPFATTSVHGGTVVISPDGNYTYTPPKGFIGVDSFTYIVRDSSGGTARATVFITVSPILAPENFKGCLYKCVLLNRTEYSVEVTWVPSKTSAVTAYRIYVDGKVVAQVAASAPLRYRVCLPSKASANTIQITAIDALNNESAFKNIRIINE